MIRKCHSSIRKALGFVCIAVFTILLMPSAEAKSGDRMKKSLFFGTTEFGAIGWIKANTEEAAKEAAFVHDLSELQCAELDDRRWFWFLANHRKPDRDGVTAFFLITVRALDLGDANSGLLLYRNANWFDTARPVQAVKPMSWPVDLVVDPAGALRSFLQLHDDRMGKDGDVAERENSVQKTYNVWHASVLPKLPSTWTSRSLILRHTFEPTGPFDIDLLSKGLIVSHRLMRFTSTVKTKTSAPVIFGIDREKMPANRYEIAVSSPEFGVIDKRTVVTARTKCPARP